MAKKWAKQEIQLTAYQKTVHKIKNWVKHNRRQIFTALVAAIVILILVSYSVIRHRKKQITAWKKFSTIQTEIEKSEKPLESLNKIDELVKKYPDYPASAYALMFKGDILYENEKYEDAANTYNKIISNKKFADYIPFAVNSLLYCYLSQNKTDEFLNTAQDFVAKYPKHLLTPQVYMQLAAAYTQKGEKEKADEIYNKLAVQYIDSPWGQSAKMMLEAQKRPNEKPQGEEDDGQVQMDAIFKSNKKSEKNIE
jgi:predicted negative regulator of RcsB-dependent stress response